MLTNKSFESEEDLPHYIIWQALIWERFARFSPAIIFLIISIFYFFGFRNWDLVIDSLIALFIVIGIVWWLWVIYTIATIAYVIERSSSRLVDVINDIRNVKEEIRNF